MRPFYCVWIKIFEIFLAKPRSNKGAKKGIKQLVLNN